MRVMSENIFSYEMFMSEHPITDVSNNQRVETLSKLVLKNFSLDILLMSYRLKYCVMKDVRNPKQTC